MNFKKVLILDDDVQLCDFLAQGLALEFDVTTVQNIDLAYQIVTKNPPDILLIDIHLKDGNGNGIDFCEKLRKNQITKKIPILLFTGTGNTEKMLAAYSVGADDYIEKPVDLAVIRNRLKARINRARDFNTDGDKFENLKLFPERFEIEIDGKLCKLSEIEFQLLKIFLEHPNKKISREEILHTVWDGAQVNERTIDVHVSTLRKKLKDFNHTIKSLYGSGYILRPVDKPLSKSKFD